MVSLRAYLKIRKLSIVRYWKSLPLLINLLAIGCFTGIFLLLFRLHINFSSYKESGIIVLCYIVLCLHFSLTKSQQLLLQNYAVSVRIIMLLRNILFSLPFFVIQWKIGLICLVTGLTIALLKPQKLQAKAGLMRFKPNYFFLKGSYQWLSFYRRGGFFIHLFCTFLIIMGIIHQNRNLSMAGYLLLGLIFGISPFQQFEPLYFLKIYPNPRILIKRKIAECVFNLLTILLPPAILLVCMTVHDTVQNMILACGSIAVICTALIVLALKYWIYPNAILAQLVMFFTVLFILLISPLFISMPASLGIFILIAPLYILLYQRLKTSDRYLKN